MFGMLAPAGADCPDGTRFVPLVNGSEWTHANGVWTLVGCPPGYFLGNQQCEICPGGTYCMGSSIPATPCGYSLYTLPGATAAEECEPAVFVIVTATLPITATLPLKALQETSKQGSWLHDRYCGNVTLEGSSRDLSPIFIGCCGKQCDVP